MNVQEKGKVKGKEAPEVGDYYFVDSEMIKDNDLLNGKKLVKILEINDTSIEIEVVI